MNKIILLIYLGKSNKFTQLILLIPLCRILNISDNGICNNLLKWYEILNNSNIILEKRDI